MNNNLRIYTINVPLRYYTYALDSKEKDSEFVMGLKQDIIWEAERYIEETIEDTDKICRTQENIHFHLWCGNDKEDVNIPESYFNCEITNIVAHDRAEVADIIKPYLHKVCRTLSFLISMHNANKHSYQPRVEADMDGAVWSDIMYYSDREVSELNTESDEIQVIDGKTYQVIHIDTAPIVISSKIYMKIYGKLPTEEFTIYMKSTNENLNYMLDEYYLALGQENINSKFFHLFSIIEFIENTYEGMTDAEYIFNDKEIEEILDYMETCPNLHDKRKYNNAKGRMKQTLQKMTDLGRNAKLVNILHNMNITKIDNCGTEFDIDKKTITEITDLRNIFYHGDRIEMKKNEHISVELAVTRLMYVCEKVIESVGMT